MSGAPLYTIGYGNRKPEEFLELLREYKIYYLVDIRSKPYSKFNQPFSQNELKYFLIQNGIKYVFMGDSIGGRPDDNSCYDNEGKVDYNILQKKDFFKEGIDRLKEAYSKNLNVVIMCSESNPCECHRSKLIGRLLRDEKVSVFHIDENGKAKSQILVFNQLNKGVPDTDLFGSSHSLTSKKVYL